MALCKKIFYIIKLFFFFIILLFFSQKIVLWFFSISFLDILCSINIATQGLSSLVSWALHRVEEEYDYSCGAPLFPLSSPNRELVVIKPNLKCSTLVEAAYYRPKPLGKADMCCHCAAQGGVVPPELLAQYFTVLPICPDCTGAGKEPFTFRKKNWIFGWHPLVFNILLFVFVYNK